MQCDACGGVIPSGDERTHQSRIVCEDCYMVALSPLKTCDPWAVRSARNCEKLSGNERQVTRIQSEILQILKTEGAMEPATLLGRLGGNLQLADLHREFSILRHLEKVKGEKRGQDILWRLW